MSRSEDANASRVEPSGAAPAWWIVCSRDLANLWIGGYATLLMDGCPLGLSGIMFQ